jgi:NADH-quinone oxidoreductase subunit H
VTAFLGALLAEGDPLFNSGVDLGVVLIVILKTVVCFAVLLVGVMLMVWFERKVISDMQSRIGPNRAGPWGILQALADGTKLFFKEDLIPANADARVFRLAPILSMVPAFISLSIIPIGGTVRLFGHTTILQLADPPIGILVLLAMSSIAVYGVMLAGWSSGSKYPLLGAVRASAQMVSYEAAMGLSVVAVVLVAGSLSTYEIVQGQLTWNWNLWQLGAVPAVVFLIASTAELNRPPFDLVEAEQELVGGFNTEYSSVRFALFFLAEFMNSVTMSAVIVTLFLGGPIGPDLGVWGLGRLSPIWFLLKVFIFLFTYVWIRASLPRYRYDQLMDIGWKRLIPLSLGWLLLIAAIKISRTEDWNVPLVIAIGVAAGLVCWGVLALAMRVGAERGRAGELEEIAS